MNRFDRQSTRAVQQIFVKKIIVTESDGNVEQVRNSLRFEFTPENRSRVLDEFYNSDKKSPIALKGIAGRIMSPRVDKAHVERVSVVNGWRERRLHFMMDVELTEPTGHRITKIVSGYTDVPEAILRGGRAMLDDNVLFVINNVTTLSMPSRLGHRRITANDQVLHNPDAGDQIFKGVANEQVSHLIRPSDTYNHAFTKSALGGEDVRIGASVLKRRPEYSSRDNALPHMFLTKTLSGFDRAVETASSDMHAPDMPAKMSMVQRYIPENNPRDDQFLLSISGNGHLASKATFTWGDLRSMDKTVSDRCTYIQLGKVMRTIPAEMNDVNIRHLNPHDVERLDTVSIHSEIAARVSQSLPAIAMARGIEAVSFIATNTKGSNSRSLSLASERHNVAVMDLVCINKEVDLFELRSGFIQGLEDYLLDDISLDGVRDYEILVDFDIYGNTRIHVTADDGLRMATIPYCVPSVMDHLFSPVVTKNVAHVDHIADGVSSLARTIDNYRRDRCGGSGIVDVFGNEYTDQDGNNIDVSRRLEWDHPQDPSTQGGKKEASDKAAARF